MFIRNGNVSEEIISNFERENRLTLPVDYKKFLLDSNGGVVNNNVIILPRLGQLLIDSLFGLGQNNETDLQFWLNEFKGDLPEKSLIIGSNAGGGFLLLCTEENCAGVYYYDHSYSFSASDDNENTYLIYPSFSELIYNLIK